MDLSTTTPEVRQVIELQELVSGVSSILDDIPPEQIDTHIESSLRLLVENLGVDRSSFGEFFDDGLHFTHFYAVPEIGPAPQGVLSKLFPWLAERAFRGEITAIEHPDALPEEAREEKEYARQYGIKSHLLIPISIAGSMICGLAFGSFRCHRAWPRPIVKELKRAGEIFAHAIYRKRALQKIQNQLEFEKLISDLSARFVNISRDQVDQQIEQTMQQLLNFFQMDRIALLKVFDEGKVAKVTHAENAAGIAPAPLEINYAQHYPWHAKKILNREIVSVHIKDLPPEAELDRNSAQSIGIRSNLVIPMIIGDSVDYVLVANAIRQERSWDTEIAPRIRLLGEIFVNALLRKSSEEELLKSYDEIKLLKNHLEAEAEYLRAEIKVAYHYDDIIGESKAIRQVLNKVEQVAPTKSSVLILGETGTGKELIARAIHNISPRKNRAMVKVNCASLPATLIENELFGREKGAYTGALTRQIGRFEVADGSTIFLDEVGELSPELQTKLLRVLQEGEFERLGSSRTIKVDVRVIAATNKNLVEAVRKGTFREDLYYRLNVFPITVPSLRERPKDIPLLVMAFLNEFRQKTAKNIDSVPKQTMEALLRYHWPGNIRELRNVIEHSMILTTGNVLRVQLPQDSLGSGGQKRTLQDMEKQHITSVLESTNWVIKGPYGAAKILGLKPSTLYNKMNRLGIVHARESRRARV